MKKYLWLFSILFTVAVPSMASDINQNASGNPDHSLNSAIGTSGNFTDQQMSDAKTFNHEGYRERKKKELCDQKNANCAPDSYNEGVLIDGGLEERMSQLYALIFGGLSMVSGGGGGPKIESKGEGGKKETSDDYCMYAAMGWEMVSMLMQQGLNTSVEQETANIKDIQMRALTVLKKSHQARAKTASMQRIAYAAVSACYAYYIATGAYVDGWAWAKGVSAVGLTALYWAKVEKHESAAKLVQNVIDNLPNVGKCNPYTDTGCFCSEATSKQMYPNEFENVCVRKRHASDLVDEQLGCGAMNNGKMAYDKQCKCKANKSCFTTQIKPFNPKLNIGNNVLSTANQGFDLLAKGETNPATLSSYSTSATALALKSFPKNPKLPQPKLNEQQQKIATDLTKVVPPSVAALAAAAPKANVPGLGVGKSSGLDKLPEDTKKKVAQAIKANYNQSGGGSEAIVDEDKPGFQMPTFGEQAAAQDENSEVLSFAEKAVDNADVSNSPETPIFDIISNRYRRSGWNKVESSEMKAQ